MKLLGKKTERSKGASKALGRSISEILQQTSDRSQIQLFLQSFDPNGATKSADLTKSLMHTTFRQQNHNAQRLRAYWPLCSESALYNGPDHMAKLLRDLLPQFKKPAHLVLVDTGALNRHNIAKNALMRQPTSEALKSSFDSDGTPPRAVTQTNEEYRKQGIEAGRTQVASLNVDNLAQTLGCEITVIPWHDVSNARDFRMLFEKIMNIPHTELPPQIAKLKIEDLALFVEKQYRENLDFTKALSQILLEQATKDARIFGELLFNYVISNKCNSRYLIEEFAHMMLVLAAAGDLIHAVIQPETLAKRRSTPRKRSLFQGEILNEWTHKLLTLYLSQEFMQNRGTYHYITVGTYPDYFKKLAQDPMPISDNLSDVGTLPLRKRSIEEAYNLLEGSSTDLAVMGAEASEEETNSFDETFENFKNRGGFKDLKNSDNRKLAEYLCTVGMVKVQKAKEKSLKTKTGTHEMDSDQTAVSHPNP